MTHKMRSPMARERFGASKTFNLTEIEHLIDSPLIEAKQGVSDNIIGGTYACKVSPSNTLHANRWSDLPDMTEQVTYRVIDTDHHFTVRKKTRQTLEALLKQPVASASKCRISDRVLILRRDCGLDIKTETFKGDGTSESESFGVYFLKSKIEKVGVCDAS